MAQKVIEGDMSHVKWYEWEIEMVPLDDFLSHLTIPPVSILKLNVKNASEMSGFFNWLPLFDRIISPVLHN